MLFLSQRHSSIFFAQRRLFSPILTGNLCLLSLIFTLFPCLSSAMDDYNQGTLYFANGDYLSAISIWSPLAQQGDADAQYSMGLLYDHGKGVDKDAQLALQFFQAAVRQNHSAAQYYLGMKYYAGLGVEKNTRQALQLLTKAAQQDHLQAQFQLGNFYDKSEADKAEQIVATQWFTKAAENGYGPAQHSLATRFLTGKGTALDLQQGIFWLNKAAEQNDADAMRDLGFMYYQGMGVKKNYQQAHELLLAPAEEGSALAQFLLGEIYSSGGDGIAKNLPQAKKWYQQAQRSGSKDATKRLQRMANTQRNILAPDASQTSAKSRLSSDATRYRQLNDNLFSLQILQARQYNSISKLTEQFSDDMTYFFKINKDKQHFFVLIYGHYGSYDEANNAIATLPKALQLPSAPWIRQVKSIKSLIP